MALTGSTENDTNAVTRHAAPMMPGTNPPGCVTSKIIAYRPTVSSTYAMLGCPMMCRNFSRTDMATVSM